MTVCFLKSLITGANMLYDWAQVADLQAEIARLEDKLADTVSAHTRSLNAMRNERDEAVAREQELSDRVWQAKQEEERVARLREDEVIEMEKDIQGKYEAQIIGLQQRASEAEEKVRRHLTVPDRSEGNFNPFWNPVFFKF